MSSLITEELFENCVSFNPAMRYLLANGNKMHEVGSSIRGLLKVVFCPAEGRQLNVRPTNRGDS
jgi:hypothetical protein